MALLDNDQITENLKTLDGWRRQGDEIVREFEFDDFIGSVKFVDAVVEPAERMGHHPDLAISWNKVTVSISTHSEGGLTAADFELAAEISDLA
jgi:4a-hydroxytetrahydrobiopterin dehydratase